MSSSSEKPSSSPSSSSPLTLFGFPLTATCSDEPPASDGDGPGKKIECPFCHREFQNLQALGGHQNAHRRERQMARLAQFEYIRLHQRNQIFQAVAPLVVAQGASPTSVFTGATRFWTAQAPPESSQKLPVAEPPGTHHRLVPPVVQVPVVGVDDTIDLELRLATSSKKSGM
ncbi:Zinc finger protein 6 [Spatholobus suberectus]|nr:Zinc finger protein 6 [Spatholobus suberectus]